MATVTTYASANDVQALLNLNTGTGITLSATSVPTVTQAESFIDQIASEVDGILRASGYTVPLTGASDKRIVGRYVAQKAAAMVYHAGYGGFGDTPARVKQWEDEYAEFVKRLINRQQALVDSSPARGKVGAIYSSRYVGDT